MDRAVWETLVTALQAWSAVDFNAESEYERRREFKAFDAAIDWLLSVEPKEDN